MKNLRMWMADILIGKTPYIKGVTFYQTVCLDMDAGVYIKNCKVNLNHGIDWKIKTDGYCFNFNYYEKYISAKEQQEKTH